uniref:Uncharacterized protein n=1 Tax=Timema bartmani TaxID=61472 RepID=A0A7R9ENG5_9NEOP|nr:unnamed protein product [Timema bartmani]
MAPWKELLGHALTFIQLRTQLDQRTRIEDPQCRRSSRSHSGTPTEGIRRRLVLKSLAELDSDHNPVLVNLGRAVSFIDPPEKPDLKRTDWDRFTNVLRERLGPTPTFRTAAEIDRGAEFITSVIKGSLEASTPRHRPKRAPQASLPDSILRHVREKNRLRKAWQTSRDPVDKANWNRKVHAVREMVKEYRNSVWEDKIESLCVQDRSLWCMTRNLMRVPAPRPPIVGRNGVANSNQEKADALAEPAPLRLFGEQVRWADSAKYLGLTLDTKLTWRLHCTERLTKAKQRLGILGPLLNRRSALSTRNGLTLYKQLLRPILDYALTSRNATTRCIRACYFASATQTQFQSCIRRLTSLVSVQQYSNQEDIGVTMMVLSDSPARIVLVNRCAFLFACFGVRNLLVCHCPSGVARAMIDVHMLFACLYMSPAKYCNEKTRVAFVRARHGPHRLLASCLPLVNRIENHQVMLRILYTGATLRQCYKFIQKYQRLQLQRFWANLKTDKQRKEMEDAVMDLKITKVPTEVALDESGPDGSPPLVGAHIPYMNLFHGSFRILRWELMASDGDVVAANAHDISAASVGSGSSKGLYENAAMT